jgi:signal transduction histidine kinase
MAAMQHMEWEQARISGRLGRLYTLWILCFALLCLGVGSPLRADEGRELAEGWQMQFGSTLREEAWRPMPTRLQSMPRSGKLRDGIGWFRCQVQGAPGPMAVGLLPRWRAVEVYWDGRKIGDSGRIGSLATYGPRDAYVVFPVPASPGPHWLELKLQVGVHDRLTHPIQGIFLEQPVLYGSESWVRERASMLTAVESWSRLKSRLPYLVLVVIFGVMGLWYLQFFLRRRTPEHFWLGLVLLMMGIQQFGLSGIPKDWPFPSYRVSQVLFVQFYGTCMVFLEFMRCLAEDRLKLVLQRSRWIFVIPLLALIVLPPDLSMWFARRIGILAFFPLLAIFIASMVKAQKQGHPDAPYLLWGMVLLMLGSLVEALNFMGFVKGVDALGYAFLCFLICMAALVNDRNARAYERSEKLSRDLASQIRERERMFREIQDGYSAQICEAVLLVDGLVNQSDAGVTRTQLPAVGAILDQCLGELRDLMWVLRDGDATLMELALHVRDHCSQRLSSQGLELEFSSHFSSPEQPVTRTLRFHLFRVIQELIENTLKHASAKHVSLRIQEIDGQLALRYAEDGVGFDETAHRSGQGLELLRQRCEQIHGFVQLRSERGAGMQFTLHVPLDGVTSKTAPAV